MLLASFRGAADREAIQDTFVMRFCCLRRGSHHHSLIHHVAWLRDVNNLADGSYVSRMKHHRYARLTRSRFRRLG